MILLTPEEVSVPCDVPPAQNRNYKENFLRATRGTGRLMMFAGDQKLEHLNDDFYAPDSGVSEDDGNPKHLFEIAANSTIGVFASQLGLINLYGRDYPQIPYLAKLNSKSHLVGVNQHDPVSLALWQVKDVVEIKKNADLNIVGVGYTCYLGSEFEPQMLREAAQVVQQAHNEGLLAVIWMYPRGKSVPNEKDPHLIAGACGAAACLGADFVKVNFPGLPYKIEDFQESIQAAGRTGVICAGGGRTSVQDFLALTWQQLNVAGARGNATGRNIHQKSTTEAIHLCNALSAITLGGKSVEFAEAVYQGKQRFELP